MILGLEVPVTTLAVIVVCTVAVLLVLVVLIVFVAKKRRTKNRPEKSDSVLDIQSASTTSFQLLDIDIGEKIGQGFFAVVFKGYHKHTKEVVCLKRTLQLEDGEAAVHEANLLSSLVHPNIVKYLGVINHNGVHYIVTEFMDKGDLLTFVQQNHDQLHHADLLDM